MKQVFSIIIIICFSVVIYAQKIPADEIRNAISDYLVKSKISLNEDRNKKIDFDTKNLSFEFIETGSFTAKEKTECIALAKSKNENGKTITQLWLLNFNGKNWQIVKNLWATEKELQNVNYKIFDLENDGISEIFEEAKFQSGEIIQISGKLFNINDKIYASNKNEIDSTEFNVIYSYIGGTFDEINSEVNKSGNMNSKDEFLRSIIYNVKIYSENRNWIIDEKVKEFYGNYYSDSAFDLEKISERKNKYTAKNKELVKLDCN